MVASPKFFGARDSFPRIITQVFPTVPEFFLASEILFVSGADHYIVTILADEAQSGMKQALPNGSRNLSDLSQSLFQVIRRSDGGDGLIAG